MRDAAAVGATSGRGTARRRRAVRVLVAVLMAPAALVACDAGGGGSGPVANEWEHVTETVDGVTTVRTLSGSAWGGDARLEEDLSIGVVEGPEALTFASISGIWPLSDKVLVADSRLPAVRAFDLDGNYLFDVGRPGQGPGEYEMAGAVVGLPDGRIAVFDGSKLLVYDAQGVYMEQWASQEGGGMRFMGPGMVAVGSDGQVYIRRGIFPEGGPGMGRLRWGVRSLGPEGEGEMREAPSFDYEPPDLTIRFGDSVARMPVPFAPQVEWAMLPDGGFVAGLPTEYRFQLTDSGGDARMVVEKNWEPVPITAEEVTLQQNQMRVFINGEAPVIDWSDTPSPETKPAYDGFVVGRAGRLAVPRSGPSVVDPACLRPGVSQEDLQTMDCVNGRTWADVFQFDGTFLGTFEVPDGVNLGRGAHLEGDTLWASVQDEMGTVLVKRFRIVTPDETAP